MLVLTRKATERFQIGDCVFVTVLEIRGNTVRLGFDAPANVRILRGELRNVIAESATGFVPTVV